MSNSRTFRVPEQHCPRCAYTLDAATNIKDYTQPTPGDFTVCIRCRTILRFDYGMGVYEPSPEEYQELSLEKLHMIARLRDAIARMKAERN